MPGGLGLGFLAWGHRRGITRLAALLVAGALSLPVTVALVVAAAVAGADQATTRPGAAVPGPMPAWVVTQPYGCTGLGIEPPRGPCRHFHFGIDLAAAAGTPVSSIMPGQAEVFAASGYSGGYGLHVVVRHGDGVETMYAHLADVVIAQGAAVNTGTLLGHEGSTGMSTGPHLHFEVREGGIAVDPSRVFPGLFGPEGQPS